MTVMILMYIGIFIGSTIIAKVIVEIMKFAAMYYTMANKKQLYSKLGKEINSIQKECEDLGEWHGKTWGVVISYNIVNIINSSCYKSDSVEEALKAVTAQLLELAKNDGCSDVEYMINTLQKLEDEKSKIYGLRRSILKAVPMWVRLIFSNLINMGIEDIFINEVTRLVRDIKFGALVVKTNGDKCSLVLDSNFFRMIKSAVEEEAKLEITKS